MPLNQGAPKIAFIFSLDIPRYTAYYKRLYEQAPAFRKAVHECVEVVDKSIGQSVLKFLDSDTYANDALESNSLQNAFLFTLEYALNAFLQTDTMILLIPHFSLATLTMFQRS